jgi:adenylate cyclase
MAAIGAVEQAIDTLEHCVPHLPWQQLRWMAQDVDMDPLRNHPRYRALVERAETKFAEGQAGDGSESTTTS